MMAAVAPPPTLEQLYFHRKLIQVCIAYPGMPEYHKILGYIIEHGIYNHQQIHHITTTDVTAMRNQIAHDNIAAIDPHPQRPHVPTGTQQTRRQACEHDVQQFRRHIIAGYVYVAMHYAGDDPNNPNNVRIVPLFIDPNNHQLNLLAAKFNQILNPHCILNILENMAFYTNRSANSVYQYRGHIFHFQPPFGRVNRDTLQYTPIEITGTIQGGAAGLNPSSDFMNPAANNVDVLWNGQADLTKPPDQNQRGLPCYIAWLPNNETKPPEPTLQIRIGHNKYGTQVTSYRRDEIKWDNAMMTEFNNETVGTFCLIPSNSQAQQTLCFPSHNFNKQRRRANPRPHSYAQVRHAHRNDINMLPRVAALMATAALVRAILQSGIYNDDEANGVSGYYVYGTTDVGLGFLFHHHKDTRAPHYDSDNQEFGHASLVHVILNSDIKKVIPCPMGELGTPGHERIIKWRIGVPSIATYHAIRGHDSAPFTGATWIQFGKHYRPNERALVCKVLVRLPNGVPL